jgi:hypothetical protein
VDTSAPAGSIVDVRLERVVDDYDFAATLGRVAAAAPRVERPVARRALPVTTVGAFGR